MLLTLNSVQWSKCRATSRWGIVDKNHGKEDKPRDYHGLDGVNDNGSLNVVFANLGTKQEFLGIGKVKPEPKPVSESRDSSITTDDAMEIVLEAARAGDKPPPTNLSDVVNRLFQKGYHQTWAGFGTTKWYSEARDDVKGHLSLEYIHNNMLVLDIRARFSRKADIPLPDMSILVVAASSPNMRRLLSM